MKKKLKKLRLLVNTLCESSVKESVFSISEVEEDVWEIKTDKVIFRIGHKTTVEGFMELVKNDETSKIGRSGVLIGTGMAIPTGSGLNIADPGGTTQNGALLLSYNEPKTIRITAPLADDREGVLKNIADKINPFFHFISFDGTHSNDVGGEAGLVVRAVNGADNIRKFDFLEEDLLDPSDLDLFTTENPGKQESTEDFISNYIVQGQREEEGRVKRWKQAKEWFHFAVKDRLDAYSVPAPLFRGISIDEADTNDFAQKIVRQLLETFRIDNLGEIQRGVSLPYNHTFGYPISATKSRKVALDFMGSRKNPLRLMVRFDNVKFEDVVIDMNVVKGGHPQQREISLDPTKTYKVSLPVVDINRDAGQFDRIKVG